MPEETDRNPMLNFAHDGKLFHSKIRARLNWIGASMNALCKNAGIAFSTSDRWANGSNPEVQTVLRVEKALKTLEANYSPIATVHKTSLQDA